MDRQRNKWMQKEKKERLAKENEDKTKAETHMERGRIVY